MGSQGREQREHMDKWGSCPPVGQREHGVRGELQAIGAGRSNAASAMRACLRKAAACTPVRLSCACKAASAHWLHRCSEHSASTQQLTTAATLLTAMSAECTATTLLHCASPHAHLSHTPASLLSHACQHLGTAVAQYRLTGSTDENESMRDMEGVKPASMQAMHELSCVCCCPAPAERRASALADG